MRTHLIFVAGGLSLLTVATSAAAGGFAGFSSPYSHPSGDGPNDVAAADFNGDGSLDFASVDHWGDSITLFRGDGDATFEYSGQYPISNAPQSIAAGDFNGDGFPDLAAVGEYNSNFVAVMLNQGHSQQLRFDPPALFAVGDSPRSVTVGEFNGDGFLDVAVANRMTTDVSILLGNGDGTFQPQARYPIGGAPHAIVVADFDTDGDLDVATANWGSDQVAVLLNNGDGTFAPPLLNQVGDMPFDLDVADFNNDGVRDIVTSNFWDGTTSVLIGNGDGTFQQYTSQSIDQSNLEGVAADDFNGDGKDDIVVINGFWYTVSILLGNGDGTFQPRELFDSGSFPRGITKADLEGDGDPDLLIANLASDRVSVLLNLTEPSQRTPADITDFQVAFGTLISGTLEDLLESDDLRVRARSRPGFAASEPNLIDLRIGAASPNPTPSSIDLAVEGRLNQSGGTGKLRLRHWATNSFQLVYQYAIGSTETVESVEGIDATDRVRASDGRIELSIRQSVVATFTATGFDSFTDQVEIMVDE